MVTFEEIAQKSGLRLVRSLGKKEQTLWLAETADGERRILRRYAGADVPCRALVGSEAPQLPQVYACCDADGDTVSEEEYIDGTLLSELLRRALLNEAQAAAIARELCLGLKTLHSLGFVHRDVKPENVMLTRQGRVVLLDLDAAAPVLGTPDTNTRLLGTAGYAAPEQFGFARCDVRADIFALGVLLNVALTGEHPSVRLAGGRLGRIVRRCTNTNAAQRYANVDALLSQLPPSGPVHLCALCGGKTPGGGCVWCGGVAARKPARAAGRIAAVLALCALCALCAAGGSLLAMRQLRQEPEAVLQPQEQTQEQEPKPEFEPVTLQEPEPLTVTPWTGGDLPFLSPFLYDLDGDGQDEQYFFAVANVWMADSKLYIYPDASRGYRPGERLMESYVPLICCQNTDGNFEAVPELAGLLTDVEVEIYSSGDQPGEMIEATRRPYRYHDTWDGLTEIWATAECTGPWIILARANLNGQPVTSAIQTRNYLITEDTER